MTRLNKPILSVLIIFVIAASHTPAMAQPPLRKLIQGRESSGSENRPRLPNDQIEGTIWEYKATPEKKVLEGKKTNELQGKFRVEGRAIFDTGKRVTIPKGGPKEVLKKIKNGGELKVPNSSQQKRIGESRKLNNGKYRLDFDDKESLHGVMIVWKKPKTENVWMGTYKEMEGKKVTAEFVVELRTIED